MSYVLNLLQLWLILGRLKRLLEYFYPLFTRINKSSGDDVSKQTSFSFEMTIYLSMFGPLMKERIIGMFLLVTYNVHLGFFFKFKIFKEKLLAIRTHKWLMPLPYIVLLYLI